MLLWLQGLWLVWVVVMFVRVVVSAMLVLLMGALGGFMLAIWSGDEKWFMSGTVFMLGAIFALGFYVAEEL